MPRRNTTHEYRCESCGVTMKGRVNKRGEVKTSNAPSSDEVRSCICARCAAERPE
jgi:hypothetical protein